MRPLILRDLDFLEAEFRRISICVRSTEHLSEFDDRKLALGYEGAQDNTNLDEDVAPPTTEHWVDRFNEIARLRLEPWRQELVSRALAAEATDPGSVSLRALWAIGMLDYRKFQAFSVLLDLSCVISNGYVIPNSAQNLVIPKCDLGSDIRIGELIFELNDTDILGYRESHRHFKKGETVLASYRSDEFLVRSNLADWTTMGISPSPTGNVIAQFYTQRTHELGRKIFEQWLDGLRRRQFVVERR
jgi:hypothetical protein